MPEDTEPSSSAIDEAKLEALMGKMIGEMGAASTAPLVRIGDELGLYKAMHGAGPLSPAELAARTDTAERYVREWLSAQAAAGYVEYDSAAGAFELTPEQAMVFADDDSPVNVHGLFQIIAANNIDVPTVVEAFKTGEGVPWGAHHQCLFQGVERFFRPGYAAHIVGDWLPTLDGVVEKLERGCKVADVGCGHGASAIIMGQAFPNSTFTGFDFHDESIECARDAARESGVDGNVRFEVAAAKTYPGRDYDFVAMFDCLHDMGDPAGAAGHVFESLKPDGTWMIVEPFAHDRLEDNLNPVGRLFYAGSTMVCTPVSLSQEVGLALGAQAGEARLREVIASGGFSRFRRAAETPFNLILEARP